MGRQKVELKMKHATYQQLQKLYQKTSDEDLKIQYLAIFKFAEGYTNLKVAELLNRSYSTVRDWLNRYIVLEPYGLIPQKFKDLYSLGVKVSDTHFKCWFNISPSRVFYWLRLKAGSATPLLLVTFIRGFYYYLSF